MQILRDVAAARGRRYRFPGQLETAFLRNERRTSRGIRVVLSLIPLLVAGTAPAWQELVGWAPEQMESLLLTLELLVIAPLFAVIAWTQWRWVESNAAELLMMAGFLLIVGCLELVRYQGYSEGHVLQSYLLVTIPVAVVALTRLSIARSVGFVIGYLGVIAVWAWVDPRQVPPRGGQQWLLEALLLGAALLSALDSKIASRRQWAGRRLLEVMAFRDPLTGLSNRRALEEHYERASREAYRSDRRSLFFALADMDYFKRINDRYGHEYGDRVLAEFALAFGAFARRPLDMAARLGGDEFALLFYDCDLERGRERLEQMLQSVRDLAIEHGDNRGAIVTCSAGGVSVPAGVELSDAYRAADRCLYQAKHAGRDCIRVADFDSQGC